MVTNFNTFTSYNQLRNKKTNETMNKFGYDDRYTSGGNLFLDTLLGQKYLLTQNRMRAKGNQYNKLDQAGEFYLYQLKRDISYGYLLDKNPSLKKATNSFELSNMIYKSITGKDELFEYNAKFKPNNIKMTPTDNKTIELKKEEDNAYLEKNVLVMDRKAVYLEIDYADDFLNTFEVTVMGRVIDVDYSFPNGYHNGVIYLGTYANELIQVKVKLLKDTTITSINMAYLDLDKYDEFVKDYKVDSDIKINRNKMNIKVISDEEKILFLPINYLDGYKVTNNGKKKEVLKVYENFVGIKLNKGENKITLTYIPRGLYIGGLLSIVGLVSAGLFINKTKKKKSKIKK